MPLGQVDTSYTHCFQRYLFIKELHKINFIDFQLDVDCNAALSDVDGDSGEYYVMAHD